MLLRRNSTTSNFGPDVKIFTSKFFCGFIGLGRFGLRSCNVPIGLGGFEMKLCNFIIMLLFLGPLLSFE